MQGLFERDKNVGLHILAALGSAWVVPSGTVAGCPKAFATTAEVGFEEVAEAGAAEFKRPFLISHTSTSAAEPAIRRRGRAALPPVGAKFVELLAFFRIAQHLIGFVDGREFFFRGFFVLGHVRMVLARKVSEGFFQFILGRRARHAQGFIVVVEFNSHGAIGGAGSLKLEFRAKASGLVPG